MTDQYDAVRRRAGLIDRSNHGRIALSGRDRAPYLNGLLTNDIVALRPGGGCYAAYLTPQGRMIADMRLAETGDMILMDVEPGLSDLLVQRFDQFIFSEDVRVKDLSEQWTSFGVHGPLAASVAAAALTSERLRSSTDAGPAFRSGEQAAVAADVAGLGGLLATFEEYENGVLSFPDGREVLIVGSREFGEPGFQLYTERRHGGALRGALLDSGASEVSPEVAEVLRVESGRPAFHVDLDATTIPLEAGIEDRAISFTKGCYVGQEVIVRVMHRGHGRVARKLVGLAVEEEAARPLPEAQDVVPSSVARGDAVHVDGKEIGRITSAAYSPALARSLALAYVHRDYVEPGTRVLVAHGDARVRAMVTALPFVAPRAGVRSSE